MFLLVRITDKGMTIDLDDDDPRAVRVRAILFEQPAGHDPVSTLWKECNAPHREVLVAIAERGEATQEELEDALRIDGVALRGRHGGLAKIAKRLGVEYPIRSAGTRREVRRFSLDPGVARQVLKLVKQSPTGRRK
jgi:hypothetical protein